MYCTWLSMYIPGFQKKVSHLECKKILQKGFSPAIQCCILKKNDQILFSDVLAPLWKPPKSGFRTSLSGSNFDLISPDLNPLDNIWSHIVQILIYLKPSTLNGTTLIIFTLKNCPKFTYKQGQIILYACIGYTLEPLKLLERLWF